MQKHIFSEHFILFLVYTWVGSVFTLLIFLWNYILCLNKGYQLNAVLRTLVQSMTIICVAAFLFLSSMIMNVVLGLITGEGTIDRIKRKDEDGIGLADTQWVGPVPLEEVFGIQGYWTWLLPIDPVFGDHDRVMGYSTPQRLLREEALGEERDCGDIFACNGDVGQEISLSNCNQYDLV